MNSLSHENRTTLENIEMRFRIGFLVLAFTLADAVPCPAQSSGTIAIEDIFGRRLVDKNGLILVDWEGHIANPAIEFYIVPPANIAYPARAVLTANGERLYFNWPCEMGPQGPRKELEIRQAGKQSVLVSIYPDRDDKDESYEIQIALRDARGRMWQRKLPVRVIDQDREYEGGFPVTLDFSLDRTGFFKDEKKQQIALRAARDWLYFFDGSGLDKVPANSEPTYIRRPDDFLKGDWVTNPREYTGSLIYVVGIHTRELRSGGAPSDRGGFQSIQGKPTRIRRSGSLEIELEGNYTQKGWRVSLDDNEWWKATGIATTPVDLYSIIHHEIGHSLFFNPNNPLVARAKDTGVLENPQLTDYFGGLPRMDKGDHFPDQFDPASGFGLFGNEFHTRMPQGRWLPTKTDLLYAQAIGYRLRPTSAFAPLTLDTDKLPSGKVGARYTATLHATGGIPFYNWELINPKKLPTGFRIDSFTGALSGVPNRAGTLELAVRVRDYQKQGKGVEKTLQLEVKP
jgi:hypothetical protein